MKIVFLDAKSIGEDIDLSGFDALGEVIKTFDSGIHHIELLKYNNLAKPKYDAISADYTDFAAFPQHEKQMKAFAEKITDITGVKCIF